MATANSLTTNRGMVDVNDVDESADCKSMATAVSLNTDRDMVDAMILIRVLIVKLWLLQSLLTPTVVCLM